MPMPLYFPEKPDVLPTGGLLFAHIYTIDPFSDKEVDRGIHIITRNSPIAHKDFPDGKFRNVGETLLKMGGNLGNLVTGSQATTYVSSGNLRYTTRMVPLTTREICQIFDSLTVKEMYGIAYGTIKAQLRNLFTLDATA